MMNSLDDTLDDYKVDFGALGMSNSMKNNLYAKQEDHINIFSISSTSIYDSRIKGNKFIEDLIE